MLTFNAIDVETANADRASICQIGIIQVGDLTLDKQILKEAVRETSKPLASPPVHRLCP